MFSLDSEEKNGEVLTGVLRCSCAMLYPILEGVPRFLEGGINAFPDFFSQHREALAHICGGPLHSKATASAVANDDYDNIRKSFSAEWGFFEYGGDNTWGWPIEERKQIVLDELRMTREELAGKVLLDAGCGNGTLTAALSDLGPDVVGIDLNDGLAAAYRNKASYGARASNHVEYIQANVVNPPLKDGIFDVVYSSGVIHHTPSSKTAFDSLVRMTKKGGRLYIWVYGKRALPVRAFWWCGERLKMFLSYKALLRVCCFIAPFYKLTATILNSLGIMKFRRRTVREVAIDIFDGFAPRFNHWHTEEELRSWFKEHEFSNITLVKRWRQGLGMYGDKK